MMSRRDSLPEIAELLDRCRALPRNDRAWEEFVARYDGRAFALARRTLLGLGQRADVSTQAADLRMELWVRLVRNQHAVMRRFQGTTEPALLSYFARTLRNLAIDRIRGENAIRRPVEASLGAEELEIVLSEFEDSKADPAREVEHATLHDRIVPLLREEWRSRSTCDRDLVICLLAWFERLSAERISQIRSFGLSRGGVEKVIGRGLEALRKHWAPGAETAGGTGE